MLRPAPRLTSPTVRPAVFTAPSRPQPAALPTSYDGLIRDIATNADRFVAAGDEFFCGGTNCILINIGKSHGGSCFRESFGGHQPHARGSAGNECDFVFKR